jgi:hypothetical protein
MTLFFRAVSSGRMRTTSGASPASSSASNLAEALGTLTVTPLVLDGRGELLRGEKPTVDENLSERFPRAPVSAGDAEIVFLHRGGNSRIQAERRWCCSADIYALAIRAGIPTEKLTDR